MHGGQTVKQSINKCYLNENESHESIIRLYGAGLLSAARILVIGGKVLVKCQDEIESNRQRLTHCEVIQLLELFGFRIVDILVLVQETVPAMRYDFQKTARKNHSYQRASSGPGSQRSRAAAAPGSPGVDRRDALADDYDGGAARQSGQALDFGAVHGRAAPYPGTAPKVAQRGSEGGSHRGRDCRTAGRSGAAERRTRH